MIQINRIEEEYLKLYESKITIQQFESWIYDNEELITKQGNVQLYEDLILVNFNRIEAKTEVSKCLRVDYDLLFRYRIQSKINACLSSENLEVNNVEYQVFFDLNRLSFSFRISEISFFMNNPFDYTKFVQLDDNEKEIKFRECFKNEKLFLLTLMEEMETENIRIWHPKLTENMDRMTITKHMEAYKNELKITIDNTYIFIKTNCLKEKMKKDWV